MSDRNITLTPEQQGLKSAFKALVHAFGGQQAAASRLDDRQQRISDLGLPNTPHFARIDEVAILEDETHGTIGHPQVTRVLAKRQGYILVKLPSVNPSSQDVMGHLAIVAKEGGDIISNVLTMIEDKKITQSERDLVENEIDELIQAAMQMKADVQALAIGEIL